MSRLAVALQDSAGHWHAHGSAHYSDDAAGREQAREMARYYRRKIGEGRCEAGCCRAAVVNVSVVPLAETDFGHRIDFARWGTKGHEAR